MELAEGVILMRESPEWWWTKGRRYITLVILFIFAAAWMIRLIVEEVAETNGS